MDTWHIIIFSPFIRHSHSRRHEIFGYLESSIPTDWPYMKNDSDGKWTSRNTIIGSLNEHDSLNPNSYACILCTLMRTFHFWFGIVTYSRMCGQKSCVIRSEMCSLKDILAITHFIFIFHISNFVCFFCISI